MQSLIKQPLWSAKDTSAIDRHWNRHRLRW